MVNGDGGGGSWGSGWERGFIRGGAAGSLVYIEAGLGRRARVRLALAERSLRPGRKGGSWNGNAVRDSSKPVGTVGTCWNGSIARHTATRARGCAVCPFRCIRDVAWARDDAPSSDSTRQLAVFLPRW